jgi:hypothetical protein
MGVPEERYSKDVPCVLKTFRAYYIKYIVSIFFNYYQRINASADGVLSLPGYHPPSNQCFGTDNTVI